MSPDFAKALGEACLYRIAALDSFGTWAITLALGLAVLTSIAAIIKAFQKADQEDKTAAAPAALTAVLDSLGKLIEILGKQQVWLVLLVFGLSSFWLADSLSSTACKFPVQAAATGQAPGKPADQAPKP
jgi:hypothetical protein